MSFATTLEEIRAAATRIAGVAHRTPITTCATLDARAGLRLFLKCENLQRTGSFKFRGAWNSVASLSDEAAARGVLTHSSGNHAQALALAARLRGIPAWVVMPSNAIGAKRRAAEGYGARIVECAPTLPAREETARQVRERTGAALVPPYDAAPTIAGQGTVALEILEDLPECDAIVAPVGGGGLMSGICVAASELSPRIRLIGAEPAGADDAARSLAAGERIPQTDPRTIADGLRTSLGDLTWPILRDRLAGIVTVSEEEIVESMRLVWERAKILIEPSAAVAMAAFLRPERPLFGGSTRACVVLSGGNADLDRLPWIRTPKDEAGRETDGGLG